MEFTIAYLSACLIVAIYGRNCRIGFWGVLIFSVVLTPVLLFYGLLSLRPAVVSVNAPSTPKKGWWGRKDIQS